MHERLEGRVCLLGSGFPGVEFLEGEYVRLDEDSHRFHNDLIIEVLRRF